MDGLAVSTQLGGDGDSLEEKVEQTWNRPHPPNHKEVTKRHVQGEGDAPQPPDRSDN